MTEKEQKELNELEGAIISALSAAGYATGLMDEFQPFRWVSDETKTAELWLVNGPVESYVSNLAHDLLAVFGDLALVLVAPLVIINNPVYNIINGRTESSIVADFDLMKKIGGSD